MYNSLLEDLILDFKLFLKLISKSDTTWQELSHLKSSLFINIDLFINTLEEKDTTSDYSEIIYKYTILKKDIIDYLANLKAQAPVWGVIKINEYIDLYSLCKSIYDGDLSFVDQIFNHNDLVDPFIISPGTLLEIPVI